MIDDSTPVGRMFVGTAVGTVTAGAEVGIVSIVVAGFGFKIEDSRSPGMRLVGKIPRPAADVPSCKAPVTQGQTLTAAEIPSWPTLAPADTGTFAETPAETTEAALTPTVTGTDVATLAVTVEGPAETTTAGAVDAFLVVVAAPSDRRVLPPRPMTRGEASTTAAKAAAIAKDFMIQQKDERKAEGDVEGPRSEGSCGC